MGYVARSQCAIDVIVTQCNRLDEMCVEMVREDDEGEVARADDEGGQMMTIHHPTAPEYRIIRDEHD